MKLTPAQDRSRAKLHAALKKLQAEVATNGQPRFETVGICNSVSIKSTTMVEYSRIVELRKAAFKAWPKYSGNLDYPVPSSSRRTSSPDFMYFNTENKWWGEYGKLRKELLAFMVEYTKKSNPAWRI